MSEDFTLKGSVKARKFDGSEESAQSVQDFLGASFRVLWVKDLSQKVPAHLAVNQPNGQPVLTVTAGNFVLRWSDSKAGIMDADMFEAMTGGAAAE